MPPPLPTWYLPIIPFPTISFHFLSPSFIPPLSYHLLFLFFSSIGPQPISFAFYIFFPTLPRPIQPYHILAYRISSSPALSLYPSRPFRILPYRPYPIISYHILSYPILPYLSSSSSLLFFPPFPMHCYPSLSYQHVSYPTFPSILSPPLPFPSVSILSFPSPPSNFLPYSTYRITPPPFLSFPSLPYSFPLPNPILSDPTWP